jgi:MOSC domain-containing protein YiiM
MVNDWSGEIVSIQVAEKAKSPMLPVMEADAVVGRGLKGDRYFDQVGTFSDRPGPAREITLIESEAIEALERDLHIKLDAKDSRRNVITKGVPLNHLVGRTFKVGDVLLKGIRLCEPCSHLESLTTRGVENGLLHRGGLRAQILNNGTIRVGDKVKQELHD